MQDGFGLDSQLYFTALVELAAIPLYLLMKSHFDVWTDDVEMEQWLGDCLLRNPNNGPNTDESSPEITSPWWSRPSQQSDRGILLEVRNGTSDSRSPGAITEFLIYASVSKSTQSPSYLPSPPASSSPPRTSNDEEGSHEGSLQMIRIRAVPLASTTHQLQHVKQINQSSADDRLNDGEPYFLPTISSTSVAPLNSPPKRQRLLNLFEDATYKRKRLSRRGGEGISKAMAGLNSPTLHLEKQRGSEPDESKPNSKLHLNLQRQLGGRGLSRSSSVSSIRDMELARLQSRPQGHVDAKRSSLYGVEGMSLIGKSATLSPETNSFEEQNRSALTRVVMAGMRIYGLQQRRKSIKIQTWSGLEADSPFNDLSVPRGDDEYKMIYHQTLKAATFTFRTQMNKEIINQAAMGDVVDQLLALFCTNPLTVQDGVDSFKPGLVRNEG